MPHLYISYAPENFEFAEAVQRRLERNGCEVWIDSSPADLPDDAAQSRDWRQEIDEAIRRSFALITIVTPHARAFEYVTYEWMFALGVGIPVVALLFEHTELPPRLKALPVLDFTQPRRAPWSQLLDLVQGYEARASGAVTAQPHGPPISGTAATLAGTGQARTLLDLVQMIRAGEAEAQRSALMALAELNPDALVSLTQMALQRDELRIPLVQQIIDRTLPPPRHVFLSYSRRDADLMHRLRDDMRQSDLAVWTDDALTPGDPQWQLAIQGAIEAAGSVVVIMTPDSKKSEWVLAELQYARTHKVVIVPVLMRGSEADAVPMAFINWQWLDLRGEALYGAGLSKLVGA
ncbi:MAG: toll/interleukin-1 receptor domain-containing protein, partial [Anaerolineae bacterium]|nr:toll/interleukin-1 receptor domain-containing protein [Anaerolineae bacterium]